MEPLDVDEIPTGALLMMDTAPIIYVLEKHPELGQRFEPLFKAHAAGKLEFAVTTVTISEVLTGPARSDNGALLREYRSLLESWRVTPLDIDIAAEAALLRAAYGLKLPDAVQAASALLHRAYALVTNDKGFSQIRTLRVIS
jgi:predicted nucleic acid-binding protein